MPFQRPLEYSLSKNFLAHNARASYAVKENPAYTVTSLANVLVKPLLSLHVVI